MKCKAERENFYSIRVFSINRTASSDEDNEFDFLEAGNNINLQKIIN